MFFGGYPITPASAILHHLSRLKEYDVTTFQAEDEIAAICASIGASYGGSLGVTSSSGPGIALKGEAMGLAIMTELPLVIVRSEEHTSELQSLMRSSYAVLCLKKKTNIDTLHTHQHQSIPQQ